MPAKISATVVTGFLGAGKTTLIRHLLENAGGRRIALIINEFGDLGIDGGILQGCGIEGCDPGDMIELSNGCICCAVADDFIPAITKLIDRAEPPDHIVIETSGLALPQPLVRAFNWPDIRTRVTVDGVITVVDGKALAEGRFAWDEAAVDAQRAADPALDHDVPVAELFEDQLACADLVLVNKADLLGEAEADALAADLRARARPGVRLLPAEHGRLPVEVLLGLGIGAEEDVAARAEIHHPHAEGAEAHEHDDFESFVVVLPEAADAEALAARVAEVIARHDLLRVKGFAAVAGKPMRVVLQAVGPRVATHFDRPFGPGEARETRLVVISETGIDRAAVAEALGAAPVPA
jgi:cobalamin biosynthesis protein CobW